MIPDRVDKLMDDMSREAGEEFVGRIRNRLTRFVIPHKSLNLSSFA